MPKCYLTIDDSPSPYTEELCAYLKDRSIPAMLFVCGKMTEKFSIKSLIHAVKEGFVLGNHAYSHTHFQNLSSEKLVQEIEMTESIIDRVYYEAACEKPGLYFRFPHMDRGAGGYVVDYDQYPEKEVDFVRKLFLDGVRLPQHTPTSQDLSKKVKMQNYLSEKGYRQPFKDVTYPWFKGTELENAVDCMYTFSTSDWMLLDRHRGRWAYKTTDDLKAKIDNDKWLNSDDGNSIILMHDKPEPELLPICKTLIDHMVLKGYDFLSVSTK
jgi:peptidoglycan/xylan/chitin deacetylase (PgdA/CDA1 family)